MNDSASTLSAIFFGTPHFALESLQALVRAKFDVRAVVTQPDRPSGRGHQLTPSPVKEWSIVQGISVFQPASIRGFTHTESGRCGGLRDNEGIRLTEALSGVKRPDFLIVVAFGKILPPSLLTFPRIAAINVHASLLPRWRGAAPIQRAILAGDRETGVCIMQMEEGLDTGPVYNRCSVVIEESDTFGLLHDKLASLGGKLLVETLPSIAAGQKPTPQATTGVSYAEKWERQDSVIQWEESADTIVNRIRACIPTPGARTWFQNSVVKVTQAEVAHDTFLGSWESGVIIMVSPSEIVVSAGKNSFVAIQELQFPGRKRLAVSEILKGRDISVGERFKLYE